MEKVRKILQNRKKGLIKKASDLSILCDVKICMLIYDPHNNNNPEIWPNNAADEVKTLIHNYKLAKENCGSTTTTTTTALGPRRSKKRALDLTDIDVKDSNTSEASNKKPKSAAGLSSSSSSSVPDLWDGLDIDGLSKDQMFDLLSNLDRKIGVLQKRIDDHVAMKPYQYSAPAPPLHMLDLLASSSSSSDEYSFQTTATATYPPDYFAPAPPSHMLDLLASSSSSSDEYSFQTTATATYPPGYFQNLMIQSQQDELFNFYF